MLQEHCVCTTFFLHPKGLVSHSFSFNFSLVPPSYKLAVISGPPHPCISVQHRHFTPPLWVTIYVASLKTQQSSTDLNKEQILQLQVTSYHILTWHNSVEYHITMHHITSCSKRPDVSFLRPMIIVPARLYLQSKLCCRILTGDCQSLQKVSFPKTQQDKVLNPPTCADNNAPMHSSPLLICTLWMCLKTLCFKAICLQEDPTTDCAADCNTGLDIRSLNF